MGILTWIQQAGTPRRDTKMPNGSSSSLVTSIEYEPYSNQPTRITDPRGAVTLIDRQVEGQEAGLPRTITEPEGRVTIYWRVKQVQAASGTNDGQPALGYTTQRVYDANGNVSEVRQPFGLDGSGYTSDFFTYGLLDELQTVNREVSSPGLQTVESYTDATPPASTRCVSPRRCPSLTG